MAHRIIRLGSRMNALADLDGVQLSWPDKDLRLDAGGNRLEGTGTILSIVRERFGKLRAVALAYDTDWDFLRLRTGSAAEARLLGPGGVLRFDEPDIDRLLVEPAFGVPSTRLYNASTLAKYQGQKPDHAPGWTVVAANKHFRNDTGAAQNVYRWDWTLGGWNLAKNVAAGAEIGGVQPITDERLTTVEFVRPADWSPDGEWSFADYMEAGLIVDDAGASQRNVAYISLSAFDSRGQPGSSGLATTVKYAIGSNQFADLVPKFYGKLSLEIWTDDDCPPASYRPRLAPVRYVSLAAIAHAGGAAAPDTAIVTVPAANVERAQWIGRNAGAGNVFAQLVQPRAEDWIDQVTGVADVDPASGNTFATLASGADGAAYLSQPAGPYVKLAIGADGGGATIAARSVLSLVRRET
jgi:hypothetical protein